MREAQYGVAAVFDAGDDVRRVLHGLSLDQSSFSLRKRL